MTRMPTAAYTQNDWRVGRELLPPTLKAMKLVMEVMVIAAPAWPRVAPIYII